MTEYKLAPVEPTSEMLAAGEYALGAGCYASGIYADMLSAAPDHIPDARKKVSRPQIREAFLRNGAAIPADRDDLPDYVYESVFELMELAAPVVQGEPSLVVWVLYDATADKKYIKANDDGALAIFDSEAAARRARAMNQGSDYKRCEYYSAPQPAEQAKPTRQ